MKKNIEFKYLLLAGLLTQAAFVSISNASPCLRLGESLDSRGGCVASLLHKTGLRKATPDLSRPNQTLDIKPNTLGECAINNFNAWLERVKESSFPLPLVTLDFSRQMLATDPNKIEYLKRILQGLQELNIQNLNIILPKISKDVELDRAIAGMIDHFKNHPSSSVFSVSVQGLIGENLAQSLLTRGINALQVRISNAKILHMPDVAHGLTYGVIMRNVYMVYDFGSSVNESAFVRFRNNFDKITECKWDMKRCYGNAYFSEIPSFPPNYAPDTVEQPGTISWSHSRRPYCYYNGNFYAIYVNASATWGMMSDN